MPAFAIGIIAVYSALKLASIHHASNATAAQKHSARAQLWRRVTGVLITLLTVFAIFFARSFLRVFDCVSDGTDSGRVFMASSPEIECGDDQHGDIKTLSLAGLAGFLTSFAVLWVALVVSHRSETTGLGLLGFLTEKFEDQW